MEAKEPFGHGYAKIFDIGDIVSWSEWCSKSNSYIAYTGILMSLNIKTVGGRAVSMAKVTSINKSKEIDIFTMNLKVISKAKL